MPAHVAANFEGLVARVGDRDTGGVAGGAGHLWKLVRSFDDPATWTEPGQRHLAATGTAGPEYRTDAIPDQWELYDLDTDPIEAVNRWNDPPAAAVFDHLSAALAAERERAVPTRNEPWPYATRQPSGGPVAKTAPPPARLLRKVLKKAGLHPDDPDATEFHLPGRRALIIATNAGHLDVGKPTGVFASEMTVPYYAFLDAGMDVDIASPAGGVIPVEAVVRGRYSEIDMGNAKPGADTEHKFKASCSYYKLIVNGREVVEIDIPGMVFKVNGDDRLAAIRAAIGL